MCSVFPSDLHVITIFVLKGCPDKIKIHLSFQPYSLLPIFPVPAEQYSNSALLLPSPYQVPIFKCDYLLNSAFNSDGWLYLCH